MVDEYRDEGVPGTKDLDHRDGLCDLMARIHSNGVHLVLVERPGPTGARGRAS